MKQTEKESVAHQIINSLCDRKGFDDWWYNIDEDIQQSIIDDITEQF